MAVIAGSHFHIGPIVITHVTTEWIAAGLIVVGLTLASVRIRRSMDAAGSGAASERCRAAAATCMAALGAVLLFASVNHEPRSVELLVFGAPISIIAALIFEVAAKDMSSGRP